MMTSVKPTALAPVITLCCLAVFAGVPAASVSPDQLSHQPGATLLLPYFEVALAKKAGKKQKKDVTTVFSVGNASAAPALARVTIWTDLAVPVTAFDVYLTGYDVQALDLFDVIEGRFPATADAQNDPDDTLSPGGSASQDQSITACLGQLPPASQQPADFVEHLRASLTGQPSDLFGGLCAGRDFDEKRAVARGFVTIDSVNQCSTLLPTDAAYHANVLADTNVLFGDWFRIDRKKKSAFGDALVSIRADSADPVVTTAGNYTFYAGMNGASADDARQPLATHFGAHFNAADKQHPYFREGTWLQVWRDPKQVTQPFPCGSVPPWFPLTQEQIVVFDEEENAEIPAPPVLPPPAPPGALLPLPAVAQVLEVGGDTLPVTFEQGWVFLNLNTTVDGQVALTDGFASQGFVHVLRRGKGYEAFVRAMQLDSAAFPLNEIISP